MKAKEFLGRAHRLDVNINIKLEQIERLRSLACKVTSTFGKEKVSSGTQTKDALESAVIKIIMAEREINDEIDSLVDVKRDIADMLRLLDNEDQRLLLELRYTCLHSWKEVADKLSISLPYAYQLHKLAIGSLEVILVEHRGYAND